MDLPKVFVNCPFDDKFRPVRDAIILACVSCGFYPTSAIAKGSGGSLRISRIIDELSSSRFSIHDLSRSYGEGDYNLARFNMPLELGMAILLGHNAAEHHDWIALVLSDTPHVRYISDLGGYDPEVYDGTANTAIKKVAAHLAVQREARPGANPMAALKAMPLFDEEKELMKEDWPDRLPWARVVDAASNALKRSLGE